MSYSITSRASLITFAFVFLFGASSLVDILNARAMQQLLTYFGDVVSLRLLESSEFDNQVTRTIREVQTYVLTGEADELDEASIALTQAERSLNRLAQIRNNQHDHSSFNALYDQLNLRQSAVLAQLKVLRQRAASPTARMPAEAALLFRDIEQIERDVEQLAADSRAVLDQERLQTQAIVERSVFQNYLVIAIGIGLTLIFFLIARAFLNREIVRPILALADATAAFARGHPRPQVQVSSRNEVGMLQLSFNTLVSTIHKQTQELTAQAQVAESIREQARRAQQLADELAERNTQIAAQTMVLQAEINERIAIETSLVEARDAAQTASRAKSAFLTTMSHELRTPLTAILGYSQLLQQMAKEGDYTRVHDDLKYVLEAGKHLLDLINDLLDISRIEAEKFTITIAPIDLSRLVRSVTETAQPLLERNANRLVVTTAEPSGAFRSDEVKVRQILINLMSNAAKFTQGGQVSLTIEPQIYLGRRSIRFAVADNGIGIPASDLPKLFQMFAQLDASPTRKYGGTGIGLALSQRLAHALEGAITVESEDGVGSVFNLILPLDPADQTFSADDQMGVGHEEAAAPDMAALGANELFDQLALCVTNSQEAAVRIRQLLRSINVAMVHASSSATALEVARDLLPDSILLDLRLVDNTCWELVSQLNAEPQLRGVPVALFDVHDQQPQGIVIDTFDQINWPIDARQVRDATPTPVNFDTAIQTFIAQHFRQPQPKELEKHDAHYSGRRR